MPDVSDLTKLYKGKAIFGNSVQSPVWTENPAGRQFTHNSYGLASKVSYLLHYCRLSQQLHQSGTAQILELLLELEPDNGEVHFLLAKQYELADQFPEALSSFERAAALRPDKPEYALAASHVACMLGKRNQALEMVCNVIAAYPIMPQAYFARGLIYEVDENWGRAVRDYEMCSRLDPQSAVYHVAAATMYRRQKLYKMARWALSKALKLDPNNIRAHEELHQLPFMEQFVGFFQSNDKIEDKTAELIGKS